MENTYGQFCTVGRGAEVSCERWTPLMVRELQCSSKRFNGLHRGVPLRPKTGRRDAVSKSPETGHDLSCDETVSSDQRTAH